MSKEEVELVKSQFVTSRNIGYFEGQEGGRRKLPYAFTEQGIYMLATVLRGELAEQQSIFIMRTFREMRHYISQNQQFVTRNEMELLTAKVGTITERQDRMEKKVEFIQKDVTILADNFITDKDKKDFVIYKGQKLESDITYIEIYQQAKKSIYVVDDYMNAKSLQHLSQKADGVEVVLFTENGKGGKGFLTNSLVTDFQNEYPTIRIKPNPDCHDRLIVLDYGEETEKVYHCGASIDNPKKHASSIRHFGNLKKVNCSSPVQSLNVGLMHRFSIPFLPSLCSFSKFLINKVLPFIFLNWQAVPRYIPGAFLLAGEKSPFHSGPRRTDVHRTSCAPIPRTADKLQSYANAFYQFTFSFLNLPYIDE